MTTSSPDTKAPEVTVPDTVSSDGWASMVKYHQESNSAYDPAHKPIDHIYYSTAHFEATVYRNVYHPRNGYSASDHAPQYAEFTVKTAADGT